MVKILTSLWESPVRHLTGKLKISTGHDHDKWQDLRNLPSHALGVLLNLVDEHWTSGTVPDHLKITVIYPITKPAKDLVTPELAPRSTSSSPM